MDSRDASAPEPTWFEASEHVLDPLLTARALVGLLEGAEAVGLFRALRTAESFEGLARETGLPEQRVRDVCAALTACEVLEPAGDGLRLTPSWTALTGPTAFVPLSTALRMGEVTAAAARDVGGGGGFGELAGADRLTYAVAVSPDPFSRGVVAAMRGWVPAVVRDRMRDGDRHLELGCGVAGRMLSVLQAWPTLTAVGVERSADLAAEARRRASALGLADRFEVVCADTTTVVLDGPFDVAFWSQFFFAEESRAATLATAYRLLRRGGTLFAPLMGDADAAASDPHGSEARNLAIGRLVHGGWGVPDRSAAELVEEIRAAGFVDVAVEPTGASVITVVATRP